MSVSLQVATTLLALMLAPTGEAMAEATRLSRIFQFEMLNAQLAYLESIAGPAMHVYKQRAGVEARDYPVDGC